MTVNNLCNLNAHGFTIPPKLLNGDVSPQSALNYPINLPVLSKFFDEEALSGLSGDTKQDSPLEVRLPEFKFFNHNFSERLAADNKLKYDLKKLASAVKSNQQIFSSLSEPVFTGDLQIQRPKFLFLHTRHSPNHHIISFCVFIIYACYCIV